MDSTVIARKSNYTPRMKLTEAQSDPIVCTCLIDSHEIVSQHQTSVDSSLWLSVRSFRRAISSSEYGGKLLSAFAFSTFQKNVEWTMVDRENVKPTVAMTTAMMAAVAWYSMMTYSMMAAEQKGGKR